MRPVISIVRFLGGLIALAAILAGPPTAFWTFRGVLLPKRLPSLTDVLEALATRDDGQIFMALLAFAGIVAWLQLTAAVLIEATGYLRGIPVRRVAGIGWARKVVTGVLLLMIGTATAAAATEPAAPARETYVVRPGDSLMRIAARHLGDERRYAEIYAINRSRRQPDGESLRDVALIKPGWRLDLPAKTRVSEYRVQPGETLRSIARDRLGHANRYQEIVRLNKNVHDPDRVEAGETLQLPTAPPAITAPRPAEPEPTPSSSSPSTRAPEPPTSKETSPPPPTPPGLTTNTPLVIVGAAGLTAATVMSAIGIRRLRAARRQGHREDAASGANPIDSLDRALRQLAHHAESEGRKLPGIRMVRLGRTYATVRLSEPSEPIAPFTAAATSDEWQLTLPVPRGCEDAEAPYPFLSGLGHDPDGNLVLLGLDRAGAVVLDGAVEDIVEVAGAIAVEIVSSPWAQDVTVDLVGAGHALDDVDGIDHHLSIDDLLERLSGAADQCPHIVIAPKPLSQDDVDCLATSDAAANIVALVAGAASGTQIPGAWELDLRQRPTPMEHLDVRVALQRLPLAEPGDEAGGPQPAESVNLPPRADRDEAETPAETVLGTVTPELRLLGPVSLCGVDYSRVEGKKVNRLTELAAFLALNPGVHADGISQQLGTATQPWSAATRQGYISRLRTWLGHDQDGGLYLPNIDAKNGGYRLAGTLHCDWFRFQHLVKTANGTHRIDQLQRALDLVGGMPLSNVPKGRYEWSSWHQRDMIDHIVEVAHTLATAYRERGDLTLARRAAARGLRAEPASELLSRDLLRTELSAGNRSAVAAIALRLEETSLSLGVELESETSDLLKQAL